MSRRSGAARVTKRDSFVTHVFQMKYMRHERVTFFKGITAFLCGLCDKTRLVRDSRISNEIHASRTSHVFQRYHGVLVRPVWHLCMCDATHLYATRESFTVRDVTHSYVGHDSSHLVQPVRKHQGMSHVTHTSASYHKHMNESCHKYMNESCHTYVHESCHSIMGQYV